MKYMNQIILEGEVKKVTLTEENGKKVAKLVLANEENLIEVDVYGKIGEYLAKTAEIGRAACIVGKIKAEKNRVFIAANFFDYK